jgi:D-glycero-D-manno-heptose 1,7-bisphosphate phosphatase
LAAAKTFDIDLAASYMVGDRWRDVDAGKRAGCKTIFIDYGYAEKQPEAVNHRVQSLTDAAHIILGK